MMMYEKWEWLLKVYFTIILGRILDEYFPDPTGPFVNFHKNSSIPDTLTVQGWAKEMELSWEKVSARQQPATANHARLVLSKTVPFFCTTLYSSDKRKHKADRMHISYAWSWEGRNLRDMLVIMQMNEFRLG